jgi:peptide/nickel transport system permease protein
MKNVAQLDLGFSFRHNAPVIKLLLGRLGPTLLLMGTTLFLSLGLGVLAGLLASLWVRTWKDHAISIIAIIAYATPLFWVGLMLILTFSIRLDWFPTSGMEDVVAFNEGFARVIDIAHHLVLPSITLSLFYMALYARLMRATMLEQRGLDYVTTARAKGLTDRQITTRHVLRNALLPVVTMAGVQVGGLLGGSVVVESVFAWPGLGQLAFEALFSRDYNLLLGIFFMSACLVVLVNIVVDVIYVLLDPRIKIG